MQTDGKLEIKAFSYEASSGNSSEVTGDKFDLPRRDWKILGIDDEMVPTQDKH